MMILILIGLVILVIWLINSQNKLNNEETARQISGELRIKYPNFVRAIRQVYQNNALLHSDNDKAIILPKTWTTFHQI